MSHEGMKLRSAFFLCLGFLTIGLRAAPADSAVAAHPLSVGTSAPMVSVRTVNNEEFDLGAAVRAKPTVLIFYRGGWCPYCNAHLAELQTLEPKLSAMGYQILALSTDAPAGLKPTTEKHQLTYGLYSDREMKAANAYGVAFKVPAKMYEQYSGHGIELAPVPEMAGEHWLPVPSVFVIGRDGKIRFMHSDPDYKKRVDANELMAAAKAALE